MALNRENLQLLEKHSIVLFDGVCNLCNGAVQFILDRDRKAHFKFASIQSTIGRDLIAHFKIDIHPDHPDSIILIQYGNSYTHSGAALNIVKKMNLLWPLLYIGIIIPRFLRDGIYRWVAKNRYRWFGKTEACRLPSPETQQRFL